MSDERKPNEDTSPQAKHEQSVHDLEPEALSPSQEAKVKGGLGAVKEGFTAN